MELFSYAEVNKIEQEVINIIGPCPVRSNHYFNEKIAEYLYYQFLANPNDHRIIIYSFPLFESLIVRYRNLLMNQNLREVFNLLFIDLLNTLPTFDICQLEKDRHTREPRIDKKGNLVYARLFTFISMSVSYRIMDFNKEAYQRNKKLEEGKQVREMLQLDEDYDSPYTLDAYNEFNDFLQFLSKELQTTTSNTAKKIIQSILYVLNNQQDKASQGQEKIIELVCVYSDLPDVVIQPYYNRLINKYLS